MGEHAPRAQVVANPDAARIGVNRVRKIYALIDHLNRQLVRQWNRAGLPDLAQAEVPVLSMLWSVQLKLEYFGIPIGTVPHA